ncbi:MAG: type VI-B CRISPR-associated RNA-guided ribonuclease Cas13b [Planctomycetaceae bacterium]|jgi:hypothetical protein|nr:type VI-B CRISPR-associated RNA-guided ribonuclease Cas13b [Planctomycetaceae bacterium]
MTNTSATKNKPFWAMHTNMAANNLLAVVQYLDRKYSNNITHKSSSLKPNTDNETVDRGFIDEGFNKIKELSLIKVFEKTKKGGNIVLQAKILDDLVSYFPFLREIKKYREAAHENKKGKTPNEKNVPQQTMNPNELVELFLYFAKLIFNKRNEYTHINHEPVLLKFGNNNIDNDNNLFDLERLIEFNRRTVKERFYGEMNNREIDKFLAPLTPKIVKNKKSEFNPDYLCKHGFFNKGKDDFSLVGLAFFIAQFLEPKYIAQMVQGLRLPKEYEQLFIRVFSITHIILPRTRLVTDSELTPQTVGMDVFNELHKCPNELFNMLSPKDQKAFRFTNEETQTENLMKRFDKNRAITLMLRYLDVQEKFDSLRFHIHTGAFFNADYEKFNTLDGTTIEHRRLSKRIYCFDRLQNVQKTYFEELEKIEQKQETLYWRAESGLKPNMTEYRTDMLPKYAIEKQNEIGLTLQPKNEPSLTQRSSKHNRIVFRNPLPDCWLSHYELPVMVFLAAHGKAVAVEKRIKKFYAGWNKLRQAIANGKPVKIEELATVYHLNFDDLPDNIKTFIKSGKVKSQSVDKITKKVKDALQQMIDTTQRKLDNFRNEQNVIYNQGGFKQGKKSKQPHFKSGMMALFIARDAVKLQKPDENDKTDHKGKMTAADFQILQRSLAYFNYRKNSLKQIFAQAGLTKNPAFIEELLKGDMISIDRFFEHYLVNKIKFLNGFFNDLESCYVLRRRFVRNNKRNEVGYITKWAKQQEIQKEPVNLPRGLFTDIVIELLKEKFPDRELPPCTKKFGTHNATFLIQKFHEWNDDGSQWFYNIQRDAKSLTFRKLTKFLALKKPNKPNNIDLTEKTQKRLYDLWEKEPALTTLNLIAQEYAKNLTDTKSEETIEIEKLRQKINMLETQLKDNNYPLCKRKNIEIELPDLQKRLNCMAKKSNKIHEEKNYTDGVTKLSYIVSSFDNIERTLRHTRLQDIALYYAMLEMLKMNNLKGIRLQEIKKDAFLLGEKDQELKWTFRIPNAQLPSWDKVTLLNFILTGKMKIKNFGNFRRFINDIRLPSLLRVMVTSHWISKDSSDNYYSVDCNIIESEFDEYDRGRKTVFEIIHELEQLAIDKYKLQPKKDKYCYISFSQITKSLQISDADRQVLSIYRNAFAHHQYPEFTYVSKKKESAKSIVQDKARFADENKHLTAKSLEKNSLTKHIIERVKVYFQQVIDTEKAGWKTP